MIFVSLNSSTEKSQSLPGMLELAREFHQNLRLDHG